jgi:hypothetical protein
MAHETDVESLPKRRDQGDMSHCAQCTGAAMAKNGLQILFEGIAEVFVGFDSNQ